MFFAQEEITMSARLFTQGWDVFSPRTNLIYHRYFRDSDAGSIRLHWQDNPDWLRLAQAGRRRFEALVAGKRIDNYGLGDVRTLKEFEDFVGIDFAAKKVSRKAHEGTFIEDLEMYA